MSPNSGLAGLTRPFGTPKFHRCEKVSQAEPWENTDMTETAATALEPNAKCGLRNAL